MSKQIGVITTITPTATADAAALLDATYPFGLQGGSATQRVIVTELYEGGQAGASTPTLMLLSRNSTAGATLSKGAGLTDTFMDASQAALAAPPVIYNTTTTDAQRSSTKHLLNLSFNAFGGIVRWVAAPGEEIISIGASLDTGDMSFSAFTGGTPGALGAHIVFEAVAVLLSFVFASQFVQLIQTALV